MGTQFVRRFILLGVSLIWVTVFVAQCQATLKLYYDPLTGNVAFDTAETRSGAISLYYLGVNGRNPPWEFRWENLVRLSTSTLFTAGHTMVGDSTAGSPWRGLYTIGDVMPIGLSQEFWTMSFVKPEDGDDPRHGDPFVYGYVDIIGGGYPPDAEFIYGRPSGEFVNRWDLVDPDTLDWATAATLVYRPWSGEVIIDTTGEAGGYISAIILESQGQFVVDGFDPFFHGPFVDATEDLIGLFGDAFEPGRYSLGTILRADMSRDEFEALFRRAEFFGRAGFRSRDFNYEAEGLALTVQYVPEPSSFALFGFVLLGSLYFRMRP